MADITQTAPVTGDVQNESKTVDPKLRKVEVLGRQFGEKTYHEFSRYRFAEEREWYEEALFYQRRQWLSWNKETRRWDMMKQNKEKPKPMPVSNYLAKAINTNANNLQLPKPTAVAKDDDPRNQRAAEFAQNAIPAIDRESEMDVLTPLLAKHTALWGMGITKDVMDTTLSAGRTRVPNPTLKIRTKISCEKCGKTSNSNEEWGNPAGQAANMTSGGDQAMTPPDQGPAPIDTEQGNGFDPSTEKKAACPSCGDEDAVAYPELQLLPGGSLVYSKGKIQTIVVPLFEIYLPRACGHPQRAKRVLHRYRQSIGECKRIYGDKAGNIKAEGAQDVHQIYMEALRALVSYNYNQENALETTSVTELWSSWDETPKELQEAISEYLAEQPDKLEQCENDGLFFIYAGGVMLSWGANYMEGETPFTFFLWELDPANVYPKGNSTDLVPLQKRLNRFDSIMELACMCNGVGKWLWPTTQNSRPPSGSPNEVVPYDPIGDGKMKPEFVTPTPVAPALIALRQSILGDFEALGNVNSISQGKVPQGGKQAGFRGIALMSAKAEEAKTTTRDLWEMAHQIRWNKVLKMAKMLWDEPRSTRVAGYNGKAGMMSMKGDDLAGEFEISVVPDSSRPMTPAEKKESFAALAAGGMVNVQDPQTRDFILRMSGLGEELNLVDHLQYKLAGRQLEMMRRGQQPTLNPVQKPDIALAVFSNFALTEEFETSPPNVQQLILLACQTASQAIAAAAAAALASAEANAAIGKSEATKGDVKYIDPTKGGGAQPAPNPAALAEGLHGKDPLSKVPGHNASPQDIHGEAQKQASAVAEHHS